MCTYGPSRQIQQFKQKDIDAQITSQLDSLVFHLENILIMVIRDM